MLKRISVLFALSALSAAMPAAAATVLMTNTVSTTMNGTSMLFTTGSGSSQLKFSATALTYTNSYTPSISAAVKYDKGLSVNPSGDNRHTIDNSGAYDFILLRFDKAVILNGATFANDNWYDDAYADTDATIGYFAAHYANMGQTYATSLGSTTARNTFFNTAGVGLFANDFDSLSTKSGTDTRSFNTGKNAVARNVWIIGASINNTDKKVDSFKLTSVSYILPPPPGGVPEPSTWAMLILGMGAVGGAMRRRNRIIPALA